MTDLEFQLRGEISELRSTINSLRAVAVPDVHVVFAVFNRLNRSKHIVRHRWSFVCDYDVQSEREQRQHLFHSAHDWSGWCYNTLHSRNWCFVVVCRINRKYYDCNGEYTPIKSECMIKWTRFKQYDELQYIRIVNGCIL